MKKISNGVNKKIIGGIIIAIIVLGGIVWLARPAPYGTEGSRSGPNSQISNTARIVQNSGGAITIEEAIYDFGTISMAAGNVNHSFKIKNTSGAPVTIGKIYTSCMCTTAALMLGDKKFGPYGMPGHGFIPSINEALDPGGEATVEVVFDPAAHGPAGVGRIERIVSIENSSGQTLELGIAALVTP